MLHLTDLVLYSQQGVYIIVNERLKRCYIAQATNMLGSIQRVITELNEEIETSDAKVEILETFDNKASGELLRLRLGYYCRQYAKAGYTLYNAYKGLSYRLNTFIGQYDLIYVEVVYSSNKREILGVFNDVSEADRFVKESCESSGATQQVTQTSKLPTFATNELSLKYRNRNGL